MPRLDARARSLLEASVRAELEGNAGVALARYERVEQVRGSAHQDQLTQLVELEDVLPSWVRARWLAYQATRLATPASEARHQAAVAAAAVALDAEHPDLHGVPTDPGKLLVRLTAHNWVYRQQMVFELGGLADVIGAASPALISACGPVAEWTGARLGGYRLLESRDGTAVLEDLAVGERVKILDPGSCAELDIGDHAVGRLVPIESAPGHMAESRLLPADELTAGLVADDPDAWFDYLVREPVDGWLRHLSNWVPASLCSDVPELAWRLILMPEDLGPESPELDEAVDRINAGEHTRIEDAVRLLRGTLASWRFVPQSDRTGSGYYAAAALLSPGVLAAAESALTAPRWERSWRGLATVVAEPARSACLTLAECCVRGTKSA